MDRKWDGYPTFAKWVRSLSWLSKTALAFLLLFVTVFATCGMLTAASPLVDAVYCRDSATAIPDDEGVVRLDYRCETVTLDLAIFEQIHPDVRWRCEDGTKPVVSGTRTSRGQSTLELDCGS